MKNNVNAKENVELLIANSTLGQLSGIWGTFIHRAFPFQIEFQLIIKTENGATNTMANSHARPNKSNLIQIDSRNLQLHVVWSTAVVQALLQRFFENYLILRFT